MDTLKYFFDIEIAHSRDGIFLSQQSYCIHLLDDVGFLGCKPTSTPFASKTHLHLDSSDPYEDPPGYLHLVGRLLYLTMTCPNVCFSTQQLSQFMAAPNVFHHQAAIRLLRYLKGCLGRGLLYPRIFDMHPGGFNNANWATCLYTRRSITGYCFFWGSSLICWRTKKQTTVSRSFSEAEYRALATATCELQWLFYLFRDLHVTTD